MSVAAFGLVLLVLVAGVVITTGLPAYAALLLAALVGAVAGLASGAVTMDLLGALPWHVQRSATADGHHTFQ